MYNGASPACAVKAAASSTDGVIGIVSNGSGTSGNAVITYRGYVPCSFDGATVSGDFVTASVATAGDCHDGGATRPTGVQVLGRVESTNSVAGTYGMRAEMDSPASGGAAITSVFGRTGAVTAQSGDYGVGQVTGAAPLTSPAFTGTPTATTAVAHDNSTKIATTAYVDGTYTSNWTPLGNAFSASSGVGFNTTTSHANLFGVILRTPVYTCNVTVYVVTADNSANTYDVGIYQGTSGGTDNLLVHTGAVAGSAYATANGTNISLPWSGSACVLLAPGRYYLAMYANVASATMTLGGDSGSFDFYHLNGFSITPSSGALPSSITGPADGYSSSAAPYLLLH